MLWPRRGVNALPLSIRSSRPALSRTVSAEEALESQSATEPPVREAPENPAATAVRAWRSLLVQGFALAGDRFSRVSYVEPGVSSRRRATAPPAVRPAMADPGVGDSASRSAHPRRPEFRTGWPRHRRGPQGWDADCASHRGGTPTRSRVAGRGRATARSHACPNHR